MAAIWSLSSTKGGCGKTTLAALLASEIIRNGAPVTLIDTDPNHPLVTWAEKGNLPDSLTILEDNDPSGRTLSKTLDELKDARSFVIIDTEGSENIRSGLAMQRADLVIVPAKWSELDTNEAFKVEGFLDMARAASGRHIPSVLVPSQVETTFETLTTRLIRAEVEARGARWIDPPVLNKDAYRAIFTHGKLLQDLETPTRPEPLMRARDNAQAVARAIANAGIEMVQINPKALS